MQTIITATAANQSPVLWVRDLVAAHYLGILFQLRQYKEIEKIPDSDLQREHYILAEKGTKESALRAVAWKLGGECRVHSTNLPLESLAADLAAARELTIQIMEFAQPLEAWCEAIDEIELTIKEAGNIAKLALALLPEDRAEIELATLRTRCKQDPKTWQRIIDSLRGKKERKTSRVERLKLEIQALAKEACPVERVLKEQEIAQLFGISVSKIERLITQIEIQNRLSESKSYYLDELFDLETPGLNYVIPGMLPVGESVIFVSAPKTGKTLLAYDAAFAVATGEAEFLGENCKQGRVLIVQCDESVNTAKGRLLKRGFRASDAANVKFMDSFSITQLHVLEKELETFRPTLVVVDSLRRINAGREVSENSAEFADNIYQLKELLTRYNASGIFIHHATKNGDAVGVERVRGSSAIAGATWGVWLLDHLPEPDPNNNKRMIVNPRSLIRCFSTFSRDAEGQRLAIELNPENNHWISNGEEGQDEQQEKADKTINQRILELLHNAVPFGLEGIEIRDALNIGHSIYSYLNRLCEKRIIGTRPSHKDKRRTVYYVTQQEKQETPENLTPPSPPVSVPPAIQSAENQTQQESQGLIADRSQSAELDRNSSLRSNLENNSNQDAAVILEIDRNFDESQGGGRDYKADAELLKEAINISDWEIIEALTDNFSKEDKKQVWKLLSKEERLAVRKIKTAAAMPIGSKVAAADPYEAKYACIGIVEEISEDGARVKVCWQHRIGTSTKPHEWHEIEYLRLIP